MEREPVWFETSRSGDVYHIFGTVSGSYQAYDSLSADGFSPDALVGAFSRELTVPKTHPGRSYFHILDGQGGHYVTAARGVGLTSVENFRELGGYPAADGRRVRWGRFYRSARLGGITPADERRFARLHIRTILDLRSNTEVGQAPDPEFAGVEQQAISALCDLDKKNVNLDPAVLFAFSLPEMIADDAAFTGRYRQMPFGSEAYRWMFARLEQEAVPILFHCTAGKDRTGVAAMLILLALGVSWQTIAEDYLLTNRFLAHRLDEVLAAHYQPGQPEFVRHFLSCIAGVELRNLEAAYDEICRRCGSPEAYLDAEFGLSGARLERLRDLYLEEVSAK